MKSSAKGIALVSLLGLLVAGCSGSNTAFSTDTSTFEGSSELLADLVESNFAPSSQDQYLEAYDISSDLFSSEDEHNAFFNYEAKSKNLSTSVRIEDEEVTYSHINPLAENKYRVTCNLISDSNTQKLDVYFYLDDEGKIKDTLIIKGGSPRV